MIPFKFGDLCNQKKGKEPSYIYLVKYLLSRENTHRRIRFVAPTSSFLTPIAINVPCVLAGDSQSGFNRLVNSIFLFAFNFSVLNTHGRLVCRLQESRLPSQ